MTHFPRHTSPLFSAKPAGATASGKHGIVRDIMWGRPVFRAPALPNPRIVFDPLPFTVGRITRRIRRHA